MDHVGRTSMVYQSTFSYKVTNVNNDYKIISLRFYGAFQVIVINVVRFVTIIIVFLDTMNITLFSSTPPMIMSVM